MAAVLFDNKFILTKKLHSQYCREAFKKSRFRLKLTSAVLCVIFLLLGLLFLLFLRMPKLSIVFFVFSVYFFVFIFRGYVFSDWINYRNFQRNYGKVIVMLLEFTPVQVKVKVNSTSFSFSYNTISGAYETDDIIILLLSGKGMVEQGQVVYKNGFKNNKTVREFKEFINDKTQKDIFDLGVKGEIDG